MFLEVLENFSDFYLGGVSGSVIFVTYSAPRQLYPVQVVPDAGSMAVTAVPKHLARKN